MTDAAKQKEKISPGAMMAAQLIAEHICLSEKGALLIEHGPLAEIISRETGDLDLLEALKAVMNKANEGDGGKTWRGFKDFGPKSRLGVYLNFAELTAIEAAIAKAEGGR